MSEIFEEVFSKIQTDMIQVCLEYVEYDADCVYIYASYEDNTISCDFFYKINGKLFERHKLNDSTTRKYDVSILRQKACIKILNENMKNIISACNKYIQEIPTEIKLVYDVKNNAARSSYDYEIKYSDSADKTADDIFEEWFIQETEK